jgi:hypothetical protein
VGNGRIIEREEGNKVVRKRSGLEICCLSGPVQIPVESEKKKKAV